MNKDSYGAKPPHNVLSCGKLVELSRSPYIVPVFGVQASTQSGSCAYRGADGDESAPEKWDLVADFVDLVEGAVEAVGAETAEMRWEAGMAGGGEVADLDLVLNLDYEAKVTECGSLICRCLHGLAPVGPGWLSLRRQSGRWAGVRLCMVLIVGARRASGLVYIILDREIITQDGRKGKEMGSL
jgi:hypothetical protein